MKPLRVGWSKIDLQPNPAISLMGYEFRHTDLPPGNLGIHDPVFCRALFLEDDQGQVLLWIIWDLCLLSVEACQRQQSSIAVSCGLPREAIIISCTHTHSGPLPWEPAMDRALRSIFTRLPHFGTHSPEGEFAESLPHIALQAAQAARAHAQAGQLRLHQTVCGIGYNRRVMTAQGLAMAWNLQEQSHLQPSPSADPALVVLECQQANGPRFALVNLGAHPVCFGQHHRWVSGDWPGAMLRYLQQWVPGCEGAFLLSACGDVHPWRATEDDPSAADSVGRTVAAQVALLLEKGGRPMAEPRIVGQNLSPTQPDANEPTRLGRIGDLAYIATPGEFFAALGAEWQQACPTPLLVASNSNGWSSYWPDHAAYDQGQYEVNAALAIGRPWEAVARRHHDIRQALASLVP